LAITLAFLSCAAFAAIVPLAHPARTSFLRRLIDKLRGGHAIIATPPERSTQSGWQFIHCDDLASFQDWLGRDEMGLPPVEGEDPSLGSHLLVELFGCKQDSLEEELSVGSAMRSAADESLATVVAESFHEFKPYGVSGAVIIQESHYTIHTWPEHGYAAVDLFYCGGTVHVHRAIDVLVERFRPSRMKFLVVRRGIRTEVVRH